MAERQPKASRPRMHGYGIVGADEGDGLLPWTWARERLERARNYFFASITSASGGDRPHVMPIWGLWIDDTFQFSTDRTSRKGKNLEANPRCTVCPEGAQEAIVVEGTAGELTSAEARARFIAAYKAKYEWDVSTMPHPLYIVRPRLVFGLVEASFTKSATRWTFDGE